MSKKTGRIVGHRGQQIQTGLDAKKEGNLAQRKQGNCKRGARRNHEDVPRERGGELKRRNPRNEP